jgi:hypothetical protein
MERVVMVEVSSCQLPTSTTVAAIRSTVVLLALNDRHSTPTLGCSLWVPIMPGTDGFPEGKQEIYTTCMDIDIVDQGLLSGIEPVNKAGTINYQYQQGQDLNFAGLDLPDIANPTAVQGKSIAFKNVPSPTRAEALTSFTAQTIPFSATATGPADGQAASLSAAPSPTSDTDPFLSIHTISTSGAPGLETQTFSVIPIGVETGAGGQFFQSGPSVAEPTGANVLDDGGRGGARFSGNDTLPPLIPSSISSVPPTYLPSGMIMPPGPPPYASLVTVTLTTTVTERELDKRTDIIPQTSTTSAQPRTSPFRPRRAVQW